MGRLLTTLLTLLAATASAAGFLADDGPPGRLERPPEPTLRPTWVRKTPGHYSKDDWQRAIDSVWGPGLPRDTMLFVLDTFYGRMNRSFACFNNLDPTRWDSLYDIYRTEVADSVVSRGRFAAMMSHLAKALLEPHTFIDDILVCERTEPLPGVPLFIISGWRYDTHFGAGLTPLGDSTLLVYQVADSHPLGLLPGDLILGYDGRPWTECYRELLDAQLPIRRRYRWAAQEQSQTHTLLISAGQNWHLFDTIDIKRYPSNQVDHLPTSLMVGYEPDIVNCEQMDIPGVPKPNIDTTPMRLVSYGIVEEDSIGYIYCWAWLETAQNDFYRACSTLGSNPDLKGLIIDFRYQEGGDHRMGNKAYGYLFPDTTIYTFCGCARADPGDRDTMRIVIQPSFWTIAGRDGCYDKPIAVLIGPGAWSAGDAEAYRSRLHPRAGTFGKPTCGAFIQNCALLPIHGEFAAQYTGYELRKHDDPNGYMTHTVYEPDHYVWHARDAVGAGRDAVVDSAVAWIRAGGPPGICEQRPEVTSGRSSTSTLVRDALMLPGRSSAALLDISGRKVADLAPGSNDIRHISPGIYFLREERGLSQTRKVIVTR